MDWRNLEMPADRAIGRESDPSRWEMNTWLVA
jgi:hypothetical protein